MKKAIAAALALTLFCAGADIYGAVVPDTIMTADSAETSGTCGKSLTWTFSGGTLTVSGTGSMDANTDAKPCPWNDLKGDITSVVIGKGVESIGINMLSDCDSLTTVTLPDTLKTIGSYAFAGCDELASIVIPEGVTNIGSSSFVQCKKLSDVTIPASVTYIGALAFSGTPWLSSQLTADTPFVVVNGLLVKVYYQTAGNVAIPSTVTAICEQAAESCSKMTSLTIPDTVTSIGYNAFKGCSGLKAVTIPASVENIGMQAFLRCTALEEVVILAPDCKIYDRATTFANDGEKFSGTIKGYDGSTAEAYANKYGYNFVSLGKPPTLGDPNGDGVIDAKDASFILAEYSRLSTGENGTFTPAQKSAADVNSDGKTDSKDASRILGYYSYLSTGGEEDFNAYLSK